MSKPIRVQRKRTKGWKMPVNTVYVGRPTKWANPFPVITHDHPNINRERHLEAVEAYRHHLKTRPQLKLDAMKELAGKNLACFCASHLPCHADVLLEIANGR